MKSKLYHLGLIGIGLYSLTGMADANLVEFHIKAKTGKKSWNTREDLVELKVGQTLRIINDDSAVHRLHTFNDKPCIHQPEDSKTGEHYDCFISTTVDPDVDLFYDHNFGEKSRFYMRATN